MRRSQDDRAEFEPSIFYDLGIIDIARLGALICLRYPHCYPQMGPVTSPLGFSGIPGLTPGGKIKTALGPAACDRSGLLGLSHGYLSPKLTLCPVTIQVGVPPA